MEFLHDKGTMAICDRLDVDSSAPFLNAQAPHWPGLHVQILTKLRHQPQLKADFQNLSKHFVWNEN